jgi:hypothetical protein
VSLGDERSGLFCHCQSLAAEADASSDAWISSQTTKEFADESNRMIQLSERNVRKDLNQNFFGQMENGCQVLLLFVTVFEAQYSKVFDYQIGLDID